MSYDVAPFTIGVLSTDPSAAGLIGREFQTVIPQGFNGLTIPGGETIVKLVQASTTITCAPGQILIWTATVGSQNNTVGALAGAAAVRGTVAGFALLPTGTTSIPSGSYFYVARRGPTPINYGAAVVAQTAIAAIATGNADDTGATFDTVLGYSAGTVGAGALGVGFADLG